MDLDEKKLIESLDLFWGRLFTYNHALMKRSEDEKSFGTESFTDIIDFYLTSQAQGLLTDFLMGHQGSPGMLLTARCFLEGLAIKRLYEQNKISDLQIELLKRQVHIIEYRYYKNFSDIANEILLPEKLKKDRDDAEQFFREQLSDKFTEKQISSIIGSDIPFLCDPSKSYRKLVKENLGDEFAKLYGLYSQAIHPSVNDFYANESLWETIPNILLLILREYPSLPQSEWSFQKHLHAVFSSEIACGYQNIVDQECKCLEGISNEFRQFFEKNYISDTLTSIGLYQKETCSDKLFGLCEQVKCKWKIALDIFSSFHLCYIDSFPRQERYELLEEHERVQFNRNLGKDFSIEKAYRIYQSLYPSGVDVETFQKGFLSTSGYSIDETGSPKSLTRIVKDFVQNFVQTDVRISRDRSMLLDYAESQMISHANGYLWYANSGSWGDVNNIIIGADICILSMLQSILFVFKAHREIEETKYYKPIINVVRNGIKRMRSLCAQKDAILKIPGISL